MAGTSARVVSEIEQRTMAKVARRLVPFLILCYFVAYLDRVNVSMAKLTMDPALGITDAQFGFGAGIFFVAYFIFEVPSNLALDRFGARKWIARIMFSWGVVSGCMALIHGVTGFYFIRVLLGAAEAGFFPGIIYYLTLWFPSLYRARIVGYFMVAIPLSTVIGNPISGAILGLHGFLGLDGWQWLFILEAAPAVILSFFVWFYLTDRPPDATWLAPEERQWLVERLEAERRQRVAARHYSVLDALTNGRVLAIAVIYFGIVATNYGLSFFLPTIVKQFGLTNFATGIVSAIPYFVGAIAIVAWGYSSDRFHERKAHLAIAILISVIGLAAAALLNDPTTKMAALAVAGFGIFASLPVFWTLPTAFLSGAAAAGGIAIINSIGNLAGFAGPYAVGAIKEATGSFAGGLFAIAACALISFVVVLLLPHDARLELAPSEEQAADEPVILPH
jgi:ACS family tartrate transporter-like MFS transporter